MILPNRKYGKLTARTFIRNVRGGRVWTWDCECGRNTLATDIAVEEGDITACSKCEPREKKQEAPKGAADRPLSTREQFPNEYAIWKGIIYRCKHDPDYAGRGIKVCERWTCEGGFENFFTDMGPRPSEAHSVGRVNNDLGYQPFDDAGNRQARWELPEAQAKNQRGRELIEYEGKQCLLVELCEEKGIKLSTVRSRMDLYGMTLKEALETPVATRRGGRKSPLSPEQEEWIVAKFKGGERGWRAWAKELNAARPEGAPKVTTGAIYELLVSKGLRAEMRLYGDATVTKT